MGYILPINSYRSQQYANRLMGSSENYSKIAQLHRVNKIGDVLEDNEEIVEEEKVHGEVKKERSSLAAAKSQNEVIGYVQPNPAHMFGKYKPMVNKEAAMNAYL